MEPSQKETRFPSASNLHCDLKKQQAKIDQPGLILGFFRTIIGQYGNNEGGLHRLAGSKGCQPLRWHRGKTTLE